jgi:amidohydrolase
MTGIENMVNLVNLELEKIQDNLIKIRRSLHANPELSGQEEETMAFIAGILESLGLEVKRNLGGFGVTGTLYGKQEGRTIAIRADMDALPITEKKNTEYKSKKPGVMHACGHDVHIAIAIGAAMILSKIADKIKGNVKFIFQPCEENVGGSSNLIKEGVLKNPAVDAIIGLHVLPSIKTGKVGIKYGTMMASADKIKIIIKGKSGHAAEPHKTVDAIWVASTVVNAIHHIVSRRIDPLTPAIISLGTIQGGTAPNIIADRVEIIGTIRSLTEDARERLSKTIETVIKGITRGMDAGYECTFSKGSPPLINDDTINSLIEKTAQSVLGKENVIKIKNPTLGGEDFSLYLKKIPGAFFRIGSGNKEKDTCHPLHNDMFDVDEDAIAVGVKVMTFCAINYLKGNN